MKNIGEGKMEIVREIGKVKKIRQLDPKKKERKKNIERNNTLEIF